MTDKERQEIQHRLKNHWPFIRISEADFKLLKKLERMERIERLKQPKTPQGQEAPF